MGFSKNNERYCGVKRLHPVGRNTPKTLPSINGVNKILIKVTCERLPVNFSFFCESSKKGKVVC